MAMGTGNFPELLWPGIKKLFGTTYEEWQALWPDMVTKYDSDKAFEKYQGMTGYGLAAVKDQGGGISYRDQYQGFQREIQNITYGLGSTVTYEMMRYDQYNKFNNIAQELAKSVRRTEETVIANLLNNGFSTTLTADGLSLFNAAHLLVGDTATLANQPATAADLSQTALEQMLIDLGNFVDDFNLPIVVEPRTLVVPVEYRNIATKILETEYEVDSGNNTINPVARARLPIQVVVNPYLTDTDAWFVKTSEDDGLIMQEVDPVMLDRDNEFDSKNLKFTAMRIFGAGAVNYLGYYGSAGA